MTRDERSTYLVFRRGPHFFAVPIAVVQRIVPPQEVVHDPERGYLWRDQAYPPLDPLFPQTAAHQALILFATAHGTGGLGVDEVVGLEEIAPVHFYPIPEVWLEAGRGWIHATFFPDPQRPPVFLLRVELILGGPAGAAEPETRPPDEQSA